MSTDRPGQSFCLGSSILKYVIKKDTFVRMAYNAIS